MKRYNKRIFYIEMTFIELMYYMKDQIEKNPKYELEISARDNDNHQVTYNPEDRLSIQNCFFDDIFNVPVEITTQKMNKVKMDVSLLDKYK